VIGSLFEAMDAPPNHDVALDRAGMTVFRDMVRLHL